MQFTKDEIYEKVKQIMAELFEIDPEEITPESKLVDDLDLDSIDAVEMIVQLQKLTGKRINPEQFQSVVTVEDVVSILQKLLEEQNSQEA
ncbi:acyl carrier protein [uncultured Parasutterella sp.]|uniref:acyl carrier protein n=1 Tax=uncultured Parasutterella sp. TaxID=1263098 RepID=UPI0034A2522D